MLDAPRPARRLLAAAAVPLLLLLSGCMRLTMATTIVDDNHITIAMDIGVTKAIAQQAGTSNLCTQDGLSNGLGSGATETPYDDGTYVGCKVTGTTTLSAVSTAGSGASITHSNGAYSFTFNPSQSANTTAGGSFTSSMLDQFRVSVTFPGKVTAHSGDSTVEGNTVTWSNTADADATLTATGKDKGGMPWWAWLPIALGALALLALATVWWLRRNRARRAALAASQPWGVNTQQADAFSAGGQTMYPGPAPQNGVPGQQYGAFQQYGPVQQHGSFEQFPQGYPEQTAVSPAAGSGSHAYGTDGGVPHDPVSAAGSAWPPSPTSSAASNDAWATNDWNTQPPSAETGSSPTNPQGHPQPDPWPEHQQARSPWERPEQE